MTTPPRFCALCFKVGPWEAEAPKHAVYECVSCKVEIRSVRPPGKCHVCASRETSFLRELRDDEPGPGFCPECVEATKRGAKVAELGGILWVCADCGARGALMPGHPVTDYVRKKSGIAPPGAVTVTMSRKSGCPVCGRKGGSTGAREQGSTGAR